MTLYGKEGLSSDAAMIVSKWTGQELQLVAPGPDFKAKVNPTGAVPALQLEDGTILTQNVAILAFLAKDRLDLLGGSDIEAQAQVTRWSAFMAGDLHAVVHTLFFTSRFTTSSDENEVAQVKEAGLGLVAKKLAVLDAHMKGRKFFVGESRTIADAHITPMYGWMEKVLPDGLAPFPHLRAHNALMQSILSPGLRRRKVTLFHKTGSSSTPALILGQWAGDLVDINVSEDVASDSFKAINPTGAVPAMILDDGAVLTQNTAILQFIAAANGNATLLGGPDPAARAQVLRWSAFLGSDLHPAFHSVFFSSRFTSSRDEGAVERAKEAGLALVAAKLSILEDHMNGQDFLVGQSKTLVDAQVVPMLRWVTKAIPGGLEAFPNLARLYERLTQDDDAVKQFLPK